MVDAVLRFESLLLDPDLGLKADEVRLLTGYYELVLRWNGRLHLTTLTNPPDFLDRHLREPLVARDLLRPGAESLWDLGSGLGVPGIPLAIFLPTLHVTLVESSRKKAIFLETVIDHLHLALVSVDCRRIESLGPLPPHSILTARAVDRMGSLLPHMLRILHPSSQVVLFCSRRLLPELPFPCTLHSLPGADQRVVVVA